MASTKVISFGSPTKDLQIADGTTVAAACSQAGAMATGVVKLNGKEVPGSTKLFGDNNVITLAASKIKNADDEDINTIAEEEVTEEVTPAEETPEVDA